MTIKMVKIDKREDLRLSSGSRRVRRYTDREIHV